MITVNNLNLTINNQNILNNLSFQIKEKAIVALIGKSGSGKTTLLKTIAGIINPTNGTVKINNLDITKINNSQRAETIGFVFQNFNLFPHLTAFQNCIDPLIVHKVQNDKAQKIVQNLLQQLNIYSIKDKYPRQISGGQQQRVAITRALCLNPKILLLDEPTASLDPFNTDLLIDILKNLKENGLTIITATQDINFAKKIFDNIYLIDQGAIVEKCLNKNDLINCQNIQKFLQK